LFSSHQYILEQNPNLTERQKNQLRLETFHGIELVDDVTRLGAMNLLLHGIGV